MDRYLTRKDLFEIPAAFMPMPVLSDAAKNAVAAAIKAKTGGFYGHFMWLISPGVLASMQTNGFKRVKLESFLDNDRLKFWWCPMWTEADRKKIMGAIEGELKRPWYKNLYDFMAYPGQIFNIPWLHVPGVDICSDKAKYLKLVDKEYDLKSPDPEDVNKWLKERQPKYQVYGRYTPD